MKRKRCEQLLQSLVKDHGAGILDDLALVTLGARPFVAAFALSVHGLADRFQGQYLDAIPYPDRFPETGLRYVDRLVTQRSETSDGAPLGTRYRCIIADPAYSAEQNARNLFGMGAHVCIGRQVSLLAWTELCARLAQLHKVIEPGPLQVVAAEPFEKVVECKIYLGSGPN